VTSAALLALGANAHAQMAAPGAPPAFGGPGYAPPRLDGPIVFIRADHPRATLQVQTQLYWQDVCVTPCGVPVDPKALYRVGGRQFVPSDTFNMPRPSGQVTIEARMGSRVRSIVGTALTLGGLGAGALGGVFLLAASEQHNDSYGEPSPAKFFFTFYGVVLAIAGTVVALVGIPLWATSGTSATVE
jgi:hypothetical protein